MPGQPPRAPTVSVILPVRNRAALVEGAVRSALAQTWPYLEVIIIDGGSTDGTAEVLQRLAAVDARIRLVLNEAAEGVSAARNHGARAAQGTYLAFLDSDDSWDPRKVELQLEALRRVPAARLAYTGCRRRFTWGVDLRPRDWDRPSEGDLHAEFLRSGAINSSTLMVDREAFLAAGGFDETLRFYEDWDLVVRLSAHAPVACAPGWLVESPQLADGLSRDRESYFTALTALAAKHEPFFRNHPAAAEERLAELAWLLLVNRRPGAARWLCRALRRRPLSLHLPTLRAGYLVARYKRPRRRTAPST